MKCGLYARDRSVYMQTPVREKNLALHAKVMIVDGRQVFIGSANFDPRSLYILIPRWGFWSIARN